MKRMKNLFILSTMLLVGSSFGVTNNANKTVVADAAEGETQTSACLSGSWGSTIAELTTVNTILITNNQSEITPANSSLLSTYDVDTDDTNTVITAYVYSVNEEGKTIKECVLYTEADIMSYDAKGRPDIFIALSSVEKIIFNCPFNMENKSSMRGMFSVNSKLKQIEGLANLDTTGVEDMGEMFSNCPSLTSLDVSSFDTSKVTAMDKMFAECKSLTTIKGLTSATWNTSNVTNMASMFNNCRKLTSLDLSGLETGNVKDMSYMFFNCQALTSIDGLRNFDTSKVEKMNSMFRNCSSLISVDVSHFNTSSVTNIGYLFAHCEKLATINGLNSATWNTSKVVDMGNMFINCKSLTSIDVSGLDTENVSTFGSMFYSCERLTSIKGLENFNTSKATNMSYMFNNCYELTTLDVSSFDTRQVTNMSYMFGYSNQITSIVGLEKFDTSNVTDMSCMFANCNQLKEINVSNFNTEKVTNFCFMFYNCMSLTELDLSNFDFKLIDKENTSALKRFLFNTVNLEKILAPKNLNGNTIELPSSFIMTAIEPIMENMTLIRGSKELNILYNTLKTLKTCDEYEKAPELQDIYDGLSSTDKRTFAKLTDDDGVLLTEKLTYMVNYNATKADSGSATAGKNMVSSAIASQSPVLVVLIGCISVAFVGGYYFAQKKKYAK